MWSKEGVPMDKSVSLQFKRGDAAVAAAVLLCAAALSLTLFTQALAVGAMTASLHLPFLSICGVSVLGAVIILRALLSFLIRFEMKQHDSTTQHI